jgi:5-methylthioribose kinase
MTVTYRELFSNRRHVKQLLRDVVAPAFRLLQFPHINDDMNCTYITEANRDGKLIRAVQHLQLAIETQKESLAHGLLTSNNILVDSSAESVNVKVVDFSGFFYGPSGFDLGTYLSHFIWY